MDFDLILSKMRWQLGSWLRLYPLLIARALLTNLVISVCLWYNCFFAVSSQRQLKLMGDTFRACLWNKEASTPAARGQVSLERLMSPRSRGGLGVILPSVMIYVLRTRMVNSALRDRTSWWSHLFDWSRFVEPASGSLVRGVDEHWQYDLGTQRVRIA